MPDLRLLDNISANGQTSYRLQVEGKGGVNTYAYAASLGGGTLNIYECPDRSIKPNLPIYSSTTGEPKHLNVAQGSFLLGELVGATSPSNVTLGVRTLDD